VAELWLPPHGTREERVYAARGQHPFAAYIARIRRFAMWWNFVCRFANPKSNVRRAGVPRPPAWPSDCPCARPVGSRSVQHGRAPRPNLVRWLARYQKGRFFSALVKLDRKGTALEGSFGGGRGSKDYLYSTGASLTCQSLCLSTRPTCWQSAMR
jgi:hypothetical protein